MNLELVGLRIGERLRIKLHPDPAVYPDETIDQLQDAFQVLFEATTQQFYDPIGKLPILSRQARERLLTKWNPLTKSTLGCIHQLFEAQAERAPKAIAVVYEDTRLTYRRLVTSRPTNLPTTQATWR